MPANGPQTSVPRMTIFAAGWMLERRRASIPMPRSIPASFFAVASEAFFAEPGAILEEFPRVYGQLAKFYRQDPNERAFRPRHCETGAADQRGK